MIQINIGIVLDACGISYTKKQLTKLEECINNFIQQYIDENMNHFQQNSSQNFETENVVENVVEQKEFVKTEIKASFDEEMDFFKNENISLECIPTETNLDPLEEVISRKQMLSKSTVKAPTISTESRTDPMTFDLLKEELQENIESSLIEESNQTEQVSNVTKLSNVKKKSNVINYVTQIDNVLTEVPNIKETVKVMLSVADDIDSLQKEIMECKRPESVQTDLDPLEELDQNELSPVFEDTFRQNITKVAQKENVKISENIWENWQDLCGELDTTEFYCPVPSPKCAKVMFKSKLLLQLHKKRCHEGLDPNLKIPCPLCTFKFKPNKMHFHLIYCEPKYYELSVQGCPKCGKKFEKFTGAKSINQRRSAYGAFKNHMKLHEQITCDICQESFSRSELEEHMIAEHQEKVKCDICQESFPMSKLKGHMIFEHHKEVTKKGTKKRTKKDAPQFICEYCTKKFNHSSLLQNHVDSVHLKIKRHSCKECERVFVGPSSLKYHMTVEHGDGKEKIQCDDCGKCFLTSSHLRSHKEVSHDAKMLKCEQCVKMFSKKHRLDVHVRDVHGAKDHHCLDCDKHYTRKNYEKHMKTVHTKNFQCDKCENSFGTNSHLLHHIANNHDGIKSYKCTLCPDSFASNGGLQNHTAHCHDLKRPFICSICSQTFKLKEKLDHHIARKHELRNCETCPYCKKEFSRLKAHKPICPAKNDSHANRPRFQCPNCDKIYFDKWSLLNRHKCSLNRHLKNASE